MQRSLVSHSHEIKVCQTINSLGDFYRLTKPENFFTIKLVKKKYSGTLKKIELKKKKLVDWFFTYLGSSVSSTETDINTQLAKAWTVIDRLSVIWKSDLTDKMKRSFLQAMVVLILLYGCTTWTLTKRMEKKLDGNYTRMLRAILNKSCRQQPTKQQLYGHIPPITKTIQVRRTRHARHCWRSRDELISDGLGDPSVTQNPKEFNSLGLILVCGYTIW